MITLKTLHNTKRFHKKLLAGADEGKPGGTLPTLASVVPPPTPPSSTAAIGHPANEVWGGPGRSVCNGAQAASVISRRPSWFARSRRPREGMGDLTAVVGLIVSGFVSMA